MHVVQRGSRLLLCDMQQPMELRQRQRVSSIVVTDGGLQRPRGPHELVTCSCA